MSLFLSQIKEIFGSQTLTKRGNYYFDQTFRFDKNDTKEKFKYNYFISKNYLQTYDLYISTFNYKCINWTKEWQNYFYSHPKFNIEFIDVQNSYYIYYLNGGKEKRDDWEKNWKTILLNNKDNLSPNDKFKLDKKLFCEMCLKKTI